MGKNCCTEPSIYNHVSSYLLEYLEYVFKRAQERRSLSGHLQRPQLPQQPPGATGADAGDAHEDGLHPDDAGEDQQPTNLQEQRVDATWSWKMHLVYG